MLTRDSRNTLFLLALTAGAFSACSGGSDEKSMETEADAAVTPPVATTDAGTEPEKTVVPATIQEIQEGTIKSQTVVVVQGSVVTAVHDKGFWMQDPTNTGTHSGIRVYTNKDPNVALNDVVTVEGRVWEQFNDTELDFATVTKTGIADAIVPVELTVEEAAKEEYEGMLVKVTGVETTDANYDCTVDLESCKDKNLWQVGGSIIVFDKTYSDTDWTAHIGSANIVGVMSYNFKTRRIQPRTAADFE